MAPTSDPYDYAEAVVNAINDFAGYEADVILNAARDIARADQRAALAEYQCNIRRQ